MKKHFLMLCALFFTATAVAASPGYHLIQKIQIGGQGFWDYLSIDHDTRRLFVSHGSHVVVVDLESGKVAADIPNTPGVHGIALAPDLNRGFISCGQANLALVFDLKSLEIIGQVETGTNPDGILYDAVTKRVVACNARSNDITIFDAATGKVLATITVGGKPESPRTDGKGKVYVNNEDLSEVDEIDIRQLSVTNHFSIAPGEEPTGLAIDPVHHRIFSGCGNQILTVLDTETGKVIAQVPIGKGCDGVGFDPATGLIFCANGEGTMTVVKEGSQGKFEVVDTIATRRGARTLTVDTATHTVYLPVGQFGPPGGRGSAPSITRSDSKEHEFVVMVIGQ